MARFQLLLALALAACAFAAPAASAARAPKQPEPAAPAPAPTASQHFGFNDNAAAFGLLTATTDADLASKTGADSSRITFDWRWAEPAPGVWDLAKYDAIYNADLAKGIRPVFILMWAPSWARDAGNTCVTDCRYPPAPEHMGAWQDAVKKLVQRYPRMAALEIWNEPNLGHFWRGGLDPARYTSLVVAAHDAARSVGSPVPILGGSMANYAGADTPEKIGHRSFLKSMYEAGVKGHMDGLAIHPYPHRRSLDLFFKMFSDVRDLRAIEGDDVPLWVTETGITTAQNTTMFWLSENDQAVMLRKLYNEMSAMPDLRSMWFHTLVDSNTASSLAESGFGMMRANLTPKPSYCMFAALRGTTYKCPAKTPALQVDAAQESRWQAQHYAQAALDAARHYRVANGSWAGLTTAKLHAIDPSLSATEPVMDALPGTTADPTRVGVWVLNDASTGEESVLLCNSSKADRSYCIQAAWGRSATYGSTASSIYGTAGAITGGSTSSWG